MDNTIYAITRDEKRDIVSIMILTPKIGKPPRMALYWLEDEIDNAIKVQYGDAEDVWPRSFDNALQGCVFSPQYFPVVESIILTEDEPVLEGNRYVEGCKAVCWQQPDEKYYSQLEEVAEEDDDREHPLDRQYWGEWHWSEVQGPFDTSKEAMDAARKQYDDDVECDNDEPGYLWHQETPVKYHVSEQCVCIRYETGGLAVRMAHETQEELESWVKSNFDFVERVETEEEFWK